MERYEEPVAGEVDRWETERERAKARLGCPHDSTGRIAIIPKDLDEPSRLALAQAVAPEGWLLIPREPDAATIEALAELLHETYFDHEWAEVGDAERALWRNVARTAGARLASLAATPGTGGEGS